MRTANPIQSTSVVIQLHASNGGTPHIHAFTAAPAAGAGSMCGQYVSQGRHHHHSHPGQAAWPIRNNKPSSPPQWPLSQSATATTTWMDSARNTGCLAIFSFCSKSVNKGQRWQDVPGPAHHEAVRHQHLRRLRHAGLPSAHVSPGSELYLCRTAAVPARPRLCARHQRWPQSVCRGVFHPLVDGAAPRPSPRCAR